MKEAAKSKPPEQTPLRLKCMLRRLLEDHAVSMRAVSRATGIPESTLSGYANGAAPGKPDHARALAGFFGITMEELLFDEKPREASSNVLVQEMPDGMIRVIIDIKK